MRERAWIGRLLALTGHTVWIEGCRFSLGDPLITNELRCRALFGRYERSERELLRRYLRPELPVVELGGGLGVIACLTNTILNDPTQHVVVEANPSLISVIERHRRWNKCHFTVINAAIDYGGGTHTTLRIQGDFISARVDRSGGTPVPVVTLSDVFQRFQFSDCTVVCDIEGTETALIEREGALLAQRAAFLMVETHPEFYSEAERMAMLARLEAHGFWQVAVVRKVRWFENRHLVEGPISCGLTSLRSSATRRPPAGAAWRGAGGPSPSRPEAPRR